MRIMNVLSIFRQRYDIEQAGTWNIGGLTVAMLTMYITKEKLRP